MEIQSPKNHGVEKITLSGIYLQKGGTKGGKGVERERRRRGAAGRRACFTKQTTTENEKRHTNIAVGFCIANEATRSSFAAFLLSSLLLLVIKSKKVAKSSNK